MRLRLLQSRERERAAHGREVVQEFLEGVSAFDVVDQRLNRDPRSDEYRRAAQDVGVGVNEQAHRRAAFWCVRWRALLGVSA